MPIHLPFLCFHILPHRQIAVSLHLLFMLYHLKASACFLKRIPMLPSTELVIRKLPSMVILHALVILALPHVVFMSLVQHILGIGLNMANAMPLPGEPRGHTLHLSRTVTRAVTRAMTRAAVPMAWKSTKAMASSRGNTNPVNSRVSTPRKAMV